MYYRYFFDDLVDLGKFEYYSIEDIKKIPLEGFDEINENNFVDGSWFIYGESHCSTDFQKFETVEEAYKALQLQENMSLYERYYDL